MAEPSMSHLLGAFRKALIDELVKKLGELRDERVDEIADKFLDAVHVSNLVRLRSVSGIQSTGHAWTTYQDILAKVASVKDQGGGKD